MLLPGLLRPSPQLKEVMLTLFSKPRHTHTHTHAHRFSSQQRSASPATEAADPSHRRAKRRAARYVLLLRPQSRTTTLTRFSTRLDLLDASLQCRSAQRNGSRSLNREPTESSKALCCFASTSVSPLLHHHPSSSSSLCPSTPFQGLPVFFFTPYCLSTPPDNISPAPLYRRARPCVPFPPTHTHRHRHTALKQPSLELASAHLVSKPTTVYSGPATKISVPCNSLSQLLQRLPRHAPMVFAFVRTYRIRFV